MINALMSYLNCEVCGGELVYNPESTLYLYTDILETTIENIQINVDEIIGRFLMFECPVCKLSYKYTYKDIERIVRYKLTKQALLVLTRNKMKNTGYVMDGVLIYCGKCPGFDGNGCCTRKIYNNCDVKRFPI